MNKGNNYCSTREEKFLIFCKTIYVNTMQKHYKKIIRFDTNLLFVMLRLLETFAQAESFEPES